MTLDKVYSFDKRQELLNILHSEEPDHYSRLWLAGFLKHVGYSPEEICNIIDQECSWSDYDAVMTYNQVRSVFRGTRDISLQVSFSQLFLSSKEKAYSGKIPHCTLAYTSCSECPDKCSF